MKQDSVFTIEHAILFLCEIDIMIRYSKNLLLDIISLVVFIRQGTNPAGVV